MRRIIFVLLLLASINFVSAAVNVTVSTSESGRITNYFNQYWVVNVDGNVTITNPTTHDLFSVAIRYDLLSLSIVELSDTSYLQATQMLITRLPANSSLVIPYNIVGIALEDPALSGNGVLYTGLTKFSPTIYSDTFGRILKASLENSSYTGRNGRLISVELLNPTGFQYTINSMSVLKTPSLDPNSLLDSWSLVNDTAPVTVDPDNVFVRDFLDYNSADGEVYWLVADVIISHVTFLDDSNVTRFTETNLTLPPEYLNYTSNDTNVTNRTLQVTNELYARKLADRQIVTADSPVKISFIVNNFAQKLIPFTITDKLPPGFSFIDSPGWKKTGDVITFSDSISGKSAIVASYLAQLDDTDGAGLDFFDSATVDYMVDDAEKSSFTNTVPFIRQFVPGQRLYMQKRLSFIDNDQVEVTLTLQNLGSSEVRDLLIKEYLSDNDVFTQISQSPDEKGLWSINSLKPGADWEVTYVTSKDSEYKVLPGVFGVPARDVLKSLVLENVISAGWEAVRTAGLEIIGIGLLIGLPAAFFFMFRKPQV